MLGYGLDWGYTNHPTALVGIYYADNKYYLDQVIHETNIRNPQTIIDKMEALGVGKYDTIVADSAELMGNEVIRLAGYRIIDVKKPPNSRIAGVSIMQDKFFMVPSRCTKIIEEFQKYLWAVDRHGVSLNEPIKLWDDALDAVRYHFMYNNANPNAPRFFL